MNWGFLWGKRSVPSGAASAREKKVKEGIDFTIKRYGETLKDLARYDRGENLSSELPR